MWLSSNIIGSIYLRVEPSSSVPIGLYFGPIPRFENQSKFREVSQIPEKLSKIHQSIPEQTYFHPNWYLTIILCQYSVEEKSLSYSGQNFTIKCFVIDISESATVASLLRRYFMLAIFWDRFAYFWLIRYLVGIFSQILLLAIAMKWIYLF